MLSLFTPPQRPWLWSRLRLKLLGRLVIIYGLIILVPISKLKTWPALISSSNITTPLCSIWWTIIRHGHITFSCSRWSQRRNIILLCICIWGWCSCIIGHEVIFLWSWWSLLTLIMFKVAILAFSVWDIFYVSHILFSFMNLSESSVKSILTMPCYCSIYFCFVWISRFESLGYSLVTSCYVLSFCIFVSFTPPGWVDNGIQRCWASSRKLRFWMRIFNLETGLWAISSLRTFRPFFPPRWWSLPHNVKICRSLPCWFGCFISVFKSSLPSLFFFSNRGLFSSRGNCWAWSCGINEFWICVWVERAILTTVSACTSHRRLRLRFSLFVVTVFLFALSWRFKSRSMRRSLNRCLSISWILCFTLWMFFMSADC